MTSGSDNAVSRNTLAEGVIWKQILSFFFPVFLGAVFQQLYNTADTVIVGRFVGKEALAAVGVCATPVNLFVGFFGGLASGATVYIAQQYGAGHKKELDHAIHTTLFLGFVFAVLFTALGMLFAGPILHAVHTEPEIYDQALLYMRVYFSGMSAVVFYNMCAAVFRAMGNSRFPMLVLVICCISNVGGDLLLVAVFGMGVLGAAIATVFAMVVSAVIVTAALLRSPAIRFDRKKLSPKGSPIRKMLQLGLPVAVQSIMYSLSNLIILSNINMFGTDMTAAFSAYEKLDSVFWMTSNAFGIAITTFVGHNYGARKYDRIRQGVKTCLLMDAVTAVFLSAMMALFGRSLLMIFSTDAGVLACGRELILMISPYYVTFVFVEAIGGGIRGTGHSLIPMIFTACGICLLRILWLLFVAPLHHTISMVLFCYPLTWVVTSALFLLYTKGGRQIVRQA